MSGSFLFYDLETFGTDPARSRIAQFAAIRTDEALQPIGEPDSFFVRPAEDLLPSPDATLVTGITPQTALREGVSEAEAMQRIQALMARPDTCTLGYNSLRFDDEFVRHGLYRNFIDPYEREWRNGNCRWDLLDVLRLTYALRPDGLEWPRREDGHASFRLEDLANANAVRDGQAHEALSDVRALIGLARRLRQAQPRLWDYALGLRGKQRARSLLQGSEPVLHVSTRFPASRMNAAPVWPITPHPSIDSRMIVYDLHADPQPLLDLDAEAIAARLFVPQSALADDQARIPLKAVHLNRCPMLVAWSHLRAADFERLQIDPGQARQRADTLAAAGPSLAEKVRNVFAAAAPRTARDPDEALYDGFLTDADRLQLRRVRSRTPEQLATEAFEFADARLPELLFRYRARNWPHTLTGEEQGRWLEYRRRRLTREEGLSEFTLAHYQARIDALRATADAAQQVLLDQLQAWGQRIAADIAA